MRIIALCRWNVFMQGLMRIYALCRWNVQSEQKVWISAFLDFEKAESVCRTEDSDPWVLDLSMASGCAAQTNTPILYEIIYCASTHILLFRKSGYKLNEVFIWWIKDLLLHLDSSATYYLRVGECMHCFELVFYRGMGDAVNLTLWLSTARWGDSCKNHFESMTDRHRANADDVCTFPV